MGTTFPKRFRKCYRDSSSYSYGYQRHTIDVMMRYIELLESKMGSCEVKIIYFQDKSLELAKKVLAFRFSLKISGSTKSNCEIIFPPNFPKVPPIFAIDNSNFDFFKTSKFPINKLPTGFFEVKLWNLFFYTRPEGLINQFINKLKTATQENSQIQGRKVQSPPSLFDERFNDDKLIHPFLLILFSIMSFNRVFFSFLLIFASSSIYLTSSGTFSTLSNL